MTRANLRRAIIYPVAGLIVGSLAFLSLEKQAREERALVGTLQSGGELMARLGLLDQAAANARRILRMDPGSLDAHLLLALVDQRAGRFGASIKEYERARELTDSPGQRQYLDLVLADLARQSKDYAGAERRLQQFHKSHGDPPRACTVRGQLRADLGDHTGAVAWFKKGTLGATPDRRAYLGLARSYVKLGRKNEALATLEAAAARELRIAGLWYEVANLRRELGDADGARQALRTALTAEPRMTRRRLRKEEAAWGELAAEMLEDEAG